MSQQLVYNPDLQANNWPKAQPRADWQTQWKKHDRRAVLFDLDGTLLDTSADLGAVANSLRADAGLEPLSLEVLRPFTSQGARGMIFRGLDVTDTDPRYPALRETFLSRYQENLCVHTCFMPGLEALVTRLESAGLAWGIVTNKFSRFTTPLVAALGLTPRMAICVSGDTTAHAKPHPAPLLHACAQINLPPQAVVYVGDDRRDIQSGFNAGCFTVAVNFGFGSVGEPLAQWGADAIVQDAEALATVLLAA
jgi:2-phosphoglycolate phosphatase